VAEGPQFGPGDNRADAIVQNIPNRHKAGKHTGMHIPIGIDTELAAPAFAAQLAAGYSRTRHELLSTPNASHTIDADQIDSETTQELLGWSQVRSVLWEENDARRHAHSATRQLADPFNGPFEAAPLAGNLVVDGWIG